VFPLTDEDLALYTAVLNALQAVVNINVAYWVVYTSPLVDAINDVYSNENDNNR